jgi:hypothetical protein
MSGNWITLEVATERQAQVRRETAATHGGFRGDASERDAIALHERLRASNRIARAVAAAATLVWATITVKLRADSNPLRSRRRSTFDRNPRYR